MKVRQRRASSVRLARGVAMYLCQRVGMMKLAPIARIFSLASYASASIRGLEAKLQEGAELIEINFPSRDYIVKDGDAIHFRFNV